VDLRPSPLATSNHHRASGAAIPATLKSLLSFLFWHVPRATKCRMFQSVARSSPFSLVSQPLTRLAKLIGFTFQNIALQPEAGL
jgi:hypothetical protein